jgi:CRISPR system Cascade subunit CasD
MAQWLVVLLSAPLASFADAPGNTTRKTGDMPTRSALLGLAAAALGIRRDDQAGHDALGAALVTAAAQIHSGTPLTDFHTFQSLNQAARGAATRADALKRKDHVETAITRRDYRSDGLWQGAYRLRGADADFALATLQSAFAAPRFVLSLGRRACSLSHPLDARIIEAADVRDAFAEHLATSATPGMRAEPPKIFSLEDRRDISETNRPLTVHSRRDDPRDRSIRWSFAVRKEYRIAAGLDEDASR